MEPEERSPESARALIENCAEELVEGRFIQSAEQMLADKNKFETANNQMVQILDFLKTSSA